MASEITPRHLEKRLGNADLPGSFTKGEPLRRIDWNEGIFHRSPRVPSQVPAMRIGGVGGRRRCRSESWGASKMIARQVRSHPARLRLVGGHGDPRGSTVATVRSAHRDSPGHWRPNQSATEPQGPQGGDAQRDAFDAGSIAWQSRCLPSLPARNSAIDRWRTQKRPES